MPSSEFQLLVTSPVMTVTSVPLFILMGLVLTVIATVIKRKDKLYNKTIIDYRGIGYDVDIHH